VVDDHDWSLQKCVLIEDVFSIVFFCKLLVSQFECLVFQRATTEQRFIATRHLLHFINLRGSNFFKFDILHLKSHFINACLFNYRLAGSAIAEVVYFFHFGMIVEQRWEMLVGDGGWEMRVES